MDLATGLEGDGPIAVEFQLIRPARHIIRQLLRAKQEHRLDETGFGTRVRTHGGWSMEARRIAAVNRGDKRVCVCRTRPACVRPCLARILALAGGCRSTRALAGRATVRRVRGSRYARSIRR